MIKIISGVVAASSGSVTLDGKPFISGDPRLTRNLCIAKVHLHGEPVPPMSVGRNFFPGAEPLRGWGMFRQIDFAKSEHVALEQLHSLGIRRATDARRPVGTLSIGERQALAIARAVCLGRDY